MAAVGCIATVCVFIRLFVGTPAERSLITWGLGVALIAGWLAFLPCYNILCSLGYQRVLCTSFGNAERRHALWTTLRRRGSLV